MPRRASPASVRNVATQADTERLQSRPRVNINLATAAELEQLSGVGPVLAARIVEQRERHGPFRRPEHLISVRGFSERRFRELRPFITTNSDE